MFRKEVEKDFREYVPTHYIHLSECEYLVFLVMYQVFLHNVLFFVYTPMSLILKKRKRKEKQKQKNENK